MEEKEYLAQINQRPPWGRFLGYMRLSGPGYMQSAMTLGGGSLAACVAFGSLLGYELLWVQPLAMILGFFILGAVAKQTTHTQERPYKAFWERLNPELAVAWAVCALVATIIWHIPQYSIAAGGAEQFLHGVGLTGQYAKDQLGMAWMVQEFKLQGHEYAIPYWKFVIAGALLLGAVVVAGMYNAGFKGVRLFEFLTKLLVWMIVLAFLLIVIATGVDWARFFKGITGISFIQLYVTSEEGVPDMAIVPIVGGLAAAVGINMIFLYPYSLLNRKWGPEHKGLAFFDLFSGMLVPFILATTFVLLAVANTRGPEFGEQGQMFKQVDEIVPVLGESFGRWVGSAEQGTRMAQVILGLGVLAIGFTSIITHMLACGFIGCEMFGFRHDSQAKWWFSLLPIVGVIGVFIPFPWYLAILASSLAAPLMPLAVLCFWILMHNKNYMGEQTPRGWARAFWDIVLIVAIIVLTTGSVFAIRKNWANLQKQLGGQEAPAATAAEPEPGAQTLPGAGAGGMGAQAVELDAAPEAAPAPEAPAEHPEEQAAPSQPDKTPPPEAEAQPETTPAQPAPPGEQPEQAPAEPQPEPGEPAPEPAPEEPHAGGPSGEVAPGPVPAEPDEPVQEPIEVVAPPAGGEEAEQVETPPF